MGRQLKWKVLLILAILFGSLWSIYPLSQKINLGLDLQGGMHLILKVDTTGLNKKQAEDAAERALEIIRNRIDQFGVKEPVIHQQGKDEIVVQLPGITDRERALDLIGKTAHLEFKLVSDDLGLLEKAKSGEAPEGYELVPHEKEQLLLERKAALTGEALVTATVSFDQSQFNEPYVSLEFNAQGGREFSRITRDNVGRRLAIVLDGKVQSAPVIKERIPSGHAQITGRFSMEEASDLAIVLRAGALPAPIHIEEERTIGPLLGKDSIQSGIKASLLGGVLVVLFMCLYYLLAGIVASLAVIFNFLLILAGLALLHATLTLPGIAGMILTVGMAVDANVLIYERIREELRGGRPIRNAITTGYHKAFTAIFDSNVTTLIAAILLFWFGSGPIRGFGVTLTLGLIASMFTAIYVTRVFFDLLVESKLLKNIRMFQLIGPTKIDFIGKRRICYLLSLVVILGGMIYFLLQGDKAYGIDFTGGQIQEYRFKESLSAEQVRSSLSDIGLADVSLQQFQETHALLIRTSGDTAKEVSSELKKDFPNNPVEILRVEKVGPSVGKRLRFQATLALFYALGGILIYVWFRFKNAAFAVAGIIALFHDVFVTLGMLAVTHREVDLTVLAAILTIAGFSINDTIVIYDRIREKLRTMRKATLVEVVNLSVNETLSRTLLTSFTALLSVLALFLFGGKVINDFSFSLLVGFISGVYSTVYIASPLVIAWSGRRR
ncbi:MAG: protein translocase subunit SecD [Candidatus Omnitrophica bacterium]|nr:protein translocase subunit SecD [Candidatus Omnitrophota bacterium]